MKLWERLAPRKGTEERHNSLSFEDWTQFFSFNGATYPLMQTTQGNADEEQISRTANAAYQSNGIVFALVMARLQVFSQIRFQWTRFTEGHPGDLFGSRELSVLERPWPSANTGDLLARMELDVSLAGNCYLWHKRGPRNTGRLHRLRPDWMTIILGSNMSPDDPGHAPDVEVAGYLYDPPQGSPVVFSPEEISHYAPLPDPDNHFIGQSWITPAINDVRADDASMQHKLAFFKNAATPNLAIKYDPSVQYEKVKKLKELIEEKHEGIPNAYKTLHLGGGADPVVIGKDFQQLDFAVTQGKGESRLASDAGVPPSWVGFSEGLQGSALNAGNFTAARRRFSDGTLRHLWANACASLEPVLSKPDEGVSLWYSTHGVAFLQEDAKDSADIQGKESETIARLVRDGFTPESSIAAVQNNDWGMLEHTGLYSVQLQPAGTDPSGQSTNGEGNDSTSAV